MMIANLQLMLHGYIDWLGAMYVYSYTQLAMLEHCSS